MMRRVKQTVTCPPSTAVERAAGFVAAAIFSLAFYAAPILILTAPVVLLLSPRSPLAWVYAGPVLASALLPSRYNRTVLRSWLMRQMPKYFDYTEVLEFTDEEVLEYCSKRPTILVMAPHGVISYAGICSGLVDYAGAIRNDTILQRFPTAVATVVLQLPILKHVVGMFGLIDASRKRLAKHLESGKSCVLYPGGIAELFLSSPQEEHILARKGFIRLALSTGADVVPLYLFGNTTVLQVFKHPVLKKISRKFGVTLTLFWGRWGLPLPHAAEKLIYVRGPPLGMPKIADPTPADVDKWHGRYVSELTRLFDTYKGLRVDFKDKQITINDK
jgi:hypothetical protein